MTYALVLLFAVLAWQTPAHAQSNEVPPPNYQPVLDEALREFKAGNYVESLTLFREAHKAWPSARAARAIGRCQYELGDYVGAHHSLVDALDMTVRPLDASQRHETEQLLWRVRERLARYTITTDPPSASVRVDGEPAQPDADGSIVVALGDHLIEASATGFMDARMHVFAEGMREEKIALRLAPLVAAEPEQQPEVMVASEPALRADTPTYKKWLVWTSVAGAVAVATVATVLIVRRDEPEPARPAGGSSGVAIGVPGSVGAP